MKKSLLILFVLSGCVRVPESPELRAQLEAQASFTMKCTGDVARSSTVITLERCENDEVVCYGAYRGGIFCKFKQAQ